VVISNLPVEFVMTRKEHYTEDSRKPEVAFGTIEEDVYRRDFTINSLLFSISENIILDLTKNGITDIQNKIIRTTSNAESIFSEDPLRMLRAIRFSTKLGFKIEDQTLNSIKKNVDSISKISKERIKDEFVKILSIENAIAGINLLLETKLMDYIIPELKETIGIEQNKYHDKDVFGHICDVVKNCNTINSNEPIWKLRLAGLLHDIGKVNKRTVNETGIHFYEHELESSKIAEKVMRDLKFSNEEIELITCVIESHMFVVHDFNKRTIRRKRMKLGESKFNFLIDLCMADRKCHTDYDENIFTEIMNIKHNEKPIIETKLPVDGNEIMEFFNLTPGREVGEKLGLVKEMVLNNPEITKEEIFERLLKLKTHE